MQLMRPAEVPASPRDRVFRHSPGRALLAAFAVICASAGLVGIGRRQHSGLAYYVAGGLVLGLIVMQLRSPAFEPRESSAGAPYHPRTPLLRASGRSGGRAAPPSLTLTLAATSAFE